MVGGTFTTDAQRHGRFSECDPAQAVQVQHDHGQIDTSFNPVLDGNVEAVTYTADGQGILIAGAFTTVDGQKAVRIAKLHLDGTLDTSFKATAGTTVKDFALVGNRLILGGEFGRINGNLVRGLAAINATTGATDTSFNLPIAESRDSFAPYVQELDVSDDGNWLVIGGNFGRVGSSVRHQVAVIDSRAPRPSVANWATDRYSASARRSTTTPTSAASPSRRTTRSSWSTRRVPSAATRPLCDTSSRWELPPTKTGGGLQPTWIDYTGGDTFWAVEITEAAVYVGGHQRWTNNPRPSPGRRQRRPRCSGAAGHRGPRPLLGRPALVEPGSRPGSRRRGACTPPTTT